ncbi:RraA family protein [Pseudomonas aeruginosa]|uniref:RraA family protein n=1 Tax=Pseudomonas aeruginosa TaxID=287 RepID=UPI0009A35725|nr:RraA family protein [Pseudomonas aeruginosa]MBI8147165.1 RraA family protein [Pseudomonas aeruginosa]RQG67481.1 aldolase [Pseudomonas aeruginosa]RTW70020.1 RraA family protein [Pseudomonas aeruginosa]WCX90465.1 RraA family protein [Pseudomonas aeruginosa]HBP5523293.1 RraA family protein [Pseudomonas aeruginosa]
MTKASANTSTPVSASTPVAFDEAEVRRRFLAVDASNVGDVLDQLGLLHQGLASDFVPYPTSAGKLAGWAYTIRGQMVPYKGTGDAAKMAACAGLGPDQVSVWSGDGEGICYFGELIALGMQERGCVGALVDGGIRDVRWIGEHGFPVFARYRTPVQSIGRWKVTATQAPVYLRGADGHRVVVAPGDFILGDEDGVIVIPRAQVLDVLVEAERLTEKELAIRRELGAGLSLEGALRKYGHV